jgi:peptide/nickel transport system permease protein
MNSIAVGLRRRLFPRSRVVVRGTLLVIGLGLLLVILFPDLFAPYNPFELDVPARLQAPTGAHLFGTDEGGRDILSRVLHGARPSIGAALLVIAIAAAFGTLWGAVAGWAGGWIDRVLMRIVDVFLAFPYLVLAMAVAASIGRDLRSAIIALAVVWWPGYARMIRGQVLALKGQQHVRAARTLGASPAQLLRWHVLPHTLPQLNARVTVDIGYALVALTGLSFLGLGAQNPSPEWGLMVSNAKTYVLNAWWYAVLPGAVILLVVIYLVTLGDELSGEGA